MKRCPECDFLYEDEQRLCDMDGTALVPDSQAFPDSARPKLRVRRLYRRIALALPLIVLVVLGSYVFKQQARVTTTRQSPPVDSTPAPITGQPVSASSAETETAVEPGASDSSANANKPKARPEKAEEPDSASATPDRAVEPKAPAAVPPAKPAAKPLRPAKKVSTASDQKKDSKIASFLKKTGRLLKKPFKL